MFNVNILIHYYYFTVTRTILTSIKLEDKLRCLSPTNSFAATVGNSVRKFPERSNVSTFSAPEIHICNIGYWYSIVVSCSWPLE